MLLHSLINYLTNEGFINTALQSGIGAAKAITFGPSACCSGNLKIGNWIATVGLDSKKTKTAHL